MSINVHSTLVPLGSGGFPIAYASDVRGAFQAVAATGDLHVIPTGCRTVGMLVHVYGIPADYRLVGGIANANWILQKGTNYTHTQSSASATWTIAHSLGYHPSVTIFNSAGNESRGHITRIDDNTLTVAFSRAIAGTGYCS